MKAIQNHALGTAGGFSVGLLNHLRAGLNWGLEHRRGARLRVVKPDNA